MSAMVSPILNGSLRGLLATDFDVVLFRGFGPCSSISFDNVQSAIFWELKNLLPSRVTNRSCMEVLHQAVRLPERHLQADPQEILRVLRKPGI